MSHRTAQRGFAAFFSAGHTRSPVSTTLRGEWNRITNRSFGESKLFDALAFGPYIEVVEAGLPKAAGSRVSHFTGLFRRDQEQTEKARGGLAALLDSMVTQVRQLDFKGVLLGEAELRERMVQNAQVTEDLMKSLGLDHLVPGGQLAVRFAILPFTAAIIQDPHRVAPE